MEELAALRAARPGFQPYYAVGDINDDGVPDFAVALLDSRRAALHPPEVRIVIFHGPFRAGRNGVGITVIPAYKIERSGEVLAVFKARFEGETRYGARLDLGPSVFGSDDHWIIQFNKRTRRYGVHYFY